MAAERLAADGKRGRPEETENGGGGCVRSQRSRAAASSPSAVEIIRKASPLKQWLCLPQSMPKDPKGHVDGPVILIVDGLATGSTMKAAILALRQQAPARIVVAVPVGARETCERLRRIADCLVCLETPGPFTAVGTETGIERPGYSKRSVTRGGSVDRRQSSRNRNRTSCRRARFAPRFLRDSRHRPSRKRASFGPSIPRKLLLCLSGILTW
jgi:hypothetical protein